MMTAENISAILVAAGFAPVEYTTNERGHRTVVTPGFLIEEDESGRGYELIYFGLRSDHVTGKTREETRRYVTALQAAGVQLDYGFGDIYVRKHQ